MRKLLIALFLFIAYHSHAQFGIRGHVVLGPYLPVSSGFNEIYNSGGVYGGDVAIGFEDLYLYGKYLRFSQTAESSSTGLPSGGEAEWDQDFYFIGGRIYDVTDGVVSLFPTAAYVRSSFTETITTNDPGFEDFNQSVSRTESGFSVGLGLSFAYKILSIEGVAEYVHVKTPVGNGVVRENGNIGGVMFSVGLGLKFPFERSRVSESYDANERK